MNEPKAIGGSGGAIVPDRTDREAAESHRPSGGGNAFSRSLALMAVAAVGFVVMGACAQVASRRVPFLEVAAVRAAIGALGAFVFARVRGTPLRVGNRRVMWVRTATGIAAMICTFYALSVLPIAHVSALGNTTPLFVALLGVVWLRERIGWLVGSSLAVALSGALLILDPHGGVETFAGAVTLLAAVLASVAMVSLRKLGATESPEAVVLHFSVVAAVVCAVLSVPGAVVPSLGDAALMIGGGLGATVGQLAMTRAYQLDRAARVGAMGYLQILVSTLVGVTILDQPLVARVSIGIAAIVLAGALLVWSAKRERARETLVPPAPPT
ncbi:MAG: DMT family transporter [Deltaproteobacteria bacterium]|nr:DMT family transporter [Deltaproteobacteria bacterium]